ncbi:MAG: arylsulfatase [Planctomycetota bacterium]
MQKPNVIFVLTDDQGYANLGCHGHPVVETPNIDRFYSESARLTQFHVGPTCAPTRAGLLTGHYANSTGVWHTIGGHSLLRKDEWTLANAMQENGYKTALFGKWHLGDETPYKPEERGFGTVICHGGGGIGQTPDYWGNDYFDDTYSVNGVQKKFKGYCTDVFFAESLKYIEENKDKPFFIYLSTNAPHCPFNVPVKYFEKYRNKTESEPNARFLGMIDNIDENFGTLRNKLQELGIADNTILIFMSDNGQCSSATTGMDNPYNAGMRGMKNSEYDGGHKVPFFITYKNGNLKENYDIGEVTSFVDFMPTILDLCGIEVPEERSFHGKSLAKLLQGEEEDSFNNRITVTDSQRLPIPLKWRKSCVMQNKWRLINRDELYDIEADPLQENNIAENHSDLVETLQEGYEKWWEIVSEKMDEEIPISLGSKDAILTSHDYRNSNGDLAWNQAEIRRGKVCNGYWDVLFEESGEYEFELRRWPEEAGHKVTSAIKEEDDIDFYKEGIGQFDWIYYSGSEALDIKTAAIKIGNDAQLSKPVSKDDVSVTFKVKAEKGLSKVQTWFTNNNTLVLGAYYVYVRKVNS